MTLALAHERLVNADNAQPTRLQQLGFDRDAVIHFVDADFKRTDAQASLDSHDGRKPRAIKLHSSDEQSREISVVITSSITPELPVLDEVFLDWYYEGLLFDPNQELRRDSAKVRIYAAVFGGQPEIGAIAWQYID